MDTITIVDVFHITWTIRIMDIAEVYYHSYDWVIIELINGARIAITYKEFKKVENIILTSSE